MNIFGFWTVLNGRLGTFSMRLDALRAVFVNLIPDGSFERHFSTLFFTLGGRDRVKIALNFKFLTRHEEAWNYT